MKLCARVYENYRGKRELSVSRGNSGMVAGNVIRVDLTEYTDKYEYEYGLMDERLLDAIFNDETPEWTRKSAFSFIKQSVEGQEFLEYVFGEQLCINLTMYDLPPNPQFIDQMNNTLSASEYTREKPDINVMKEVFSRIDGDGGSYVYTIVLTDVHSNEFYYVGETIDPISRLKRHVSVGGDFAEAKRRDSTHVVEIDSIKRASRTSEQAQYEHIKSRTHSPVYGGK